MILNSNVVYYNINDYKQNRKIKIMQVEFVTKQDLNSLRKLIVDDLKKVLETEVKPKERWIKSKAARDLLQCSPGTLNSLKDKLKPAKINGTLYWNHNSIIELLEQSSSLKTNTL